MIVVNFKTYPKGIGKRAERTALSISKVKGVPIAVAPAFLELPIVKKTVGKRIMVFSQHTDPVPEGHYTGHVTAESLKEWNIDGSLLNHSERRMEWKEIKLASRRLKEEGLKSIICIPSYRDVKRASRLEPDWIAIEPPELIAGRRSVSEAEPWVIEKATSRTDIPVLCGAGIHSADDVRKALELGASGILVASAVMLSRNPAAVVRKLASGFHR